MKNPSIKNLPSIKIGSIVSVASHPFLPFNETEVSLCQPKILAYNRSTPPLMVVVEKRFSKYHDEISGEKETNSYRCIYYSSKKENYEEYWFTDKELKLIASPPDSNYEYEEEKSLKELRKYWIGKSVILTSVDLELGKQQLYQNGNEDSAFFKQKSLLDFLPPLSTVIQVSKEDQSQKYDKKSGKLVFKKGGILVKLRWLKGDSLKFSEEVLPLIAFKEVEEFSLPSHISKDKIYSYPLESPWSLEEMPSIRLKALPVSFHDVIFQHYRYRLRFKNVFNGEWLLEDQSIAIDELPVTLPLLHSIRFKRKLNKESYNGDWENKWYKIAYVDKNQRYTERVIYVRKVLTAENNEKLPIVISANCLLRKGKMRLFQVENILYSQELEKSFEEIFVQRKEEPQNIPLS